MVYAFEKFGHLVFTGEEISARTFANRIRSEMDAENREDVEAYDFFSSLGSTAFLSKKDGKVAISFGAKKQEPTERY